MCSCVGARTCMQVPKETEMANLPETGVTGSHEALSVCSRNQTLTLYKNKTLF